MTDLAQFNAGNDHAAADDDDDELQQFREQWRQEVESRKRQQQQQRQQPVTAAGVYPVKKPEQQHPMPTTTTLSEQNITADETVERSSSFKESRNQLRPRPRGILDAERSEDQMIKTGILQDEVELARAVAAVGRIQLGGGLVAAAVEGKGKEKSATTANVVYPSTTQQGKSGKQQQTHGKPISGSTTTTASTEKQQPLSPKLKHAQPVAIATDKSNRIKDHPTTNVNTNTNTKKAVEAYTRAVDLESSGQLNEALHLYRKAYKLDDLVDKAYNTAIRNMEERDRLRAQVSREEIQVVDPKEVTVTATPPPLEPYVFMTHTQLAPDYHSPLTSVASTRVGGGRLASADTHAEWTDPLTRIISRFVSQDQEDQAQHLYALDFTPEEEKWPCLLGILPDEVVENIVFFLDVQSLERFAVTCKKARLVTRVAPVWKYLCEKTYRPPLLPLEIKPVDLAIRHGYDWRSTFLEERRLRYDGLYISVCHYIRPGQSDMAWVNPTHLITYHRFLRFYPDGRVISYLTTDHPVDVVHTVRPSLRAKGTLFGQWRISTMKDTKGRDVPRIELRSLLEPGATPKYEFEMDLCLKTTTRGRWNKLEMLTYQSINLLTGEALGLSLKHQKPFYFSKVRSYKEQL